MTDIENVAYNIERMARLIPGQNTQGPSGECRKCSKCCSRVLPMPLSEFKAILDGILEDEHLVAEMKRIHSITPPLFCPFLDLTGTTDNRCKIYEKPFRPTICKLTFCGSSKNDGAINSWILEHFIVDDAVISLDLQHLLFNDPEDKSSLFDAKYEAAIASLFS